MSHDGAMDGPTLERLLSEQHWLSALAARLVRDEAERDDLVQEAWLAALRERRGILDPRAWLAGVVRNRWRETRRGYERRRAREAAGARPTVPDPQELAQSAELQQRLAQAVLALEEPYRACVLLHYWGGLAPVAIARRERIPAATVRSRLLRARELLRARFAREERGERSWALIFLPLARESRPSTVPFALTFLAGAAAVVFAVRPWQGAGVQSSEPSLAAQGADARHTASATPTSTHAAAREELAPSQHASLQEPGLALRVLDPRKQPVREARVAWSSSRGAGEAVTDDEGHCTIPGHAWGPEPELVVRVEASGLFHAERRLAFAPQSTLVLEDEVALEGRVLDADDGSPWSGAEVWPFHGHCDLPPLTTDAEGRFRLSSVPIGRTFGVAVWSPGRPYLYRLAKLGGAPDGEFVVWAHTEARVEGTVRDALTGAALAEAQVGFDDRLWMPAPAGRFTLASERSDWSFRCEAPGYVGVSVSGVGDRRDLDVLLVPMEDDVPAPGAGSVGSSVRGRVLAGDRPLRWEVRLECAGGADPRVWSGTDGVFEFSDLPEGAGIVLSTEPSGTQRLELALEREKVHEVELQLDIVRLTGVVLDSDGRAVVAEAVGFGPAQRTQVPNRVLLWARTDEDGEFSFELERELLPGTLSCNGARLQVADESAEPFVLRVAEEPVLRGTIWLRPVDARTGAPILVGSLVERRQGTWPNLGEELISSPDLLGRFPLELPPGRHELAFGSAWEGYPHVVLEPFELAEGEERELRIELERAPRVRFVFTGAEGAFDLVLQLARTLDGREGLPFEVLMDMRVEEGEIERRLPAGVYTLAAHGLAFEPEQVTLAEGDPGPIVVRATRMP